VLRLRLSRPVANLSIKHRWYEDLQRKTEVFRVRERERERKLSLRSCGFLRCHRVIWWLDTHVSEHRSASIFRAEVHDQEVYPLNCCVSREVLDATLFTMNCP
jgi:hypothetical protein